MPPDPSPATAELAYLEAPELAARIARGDLTSVEVTANLLRRIEDLDSPASPAALRSVLAVAPDALDQAREADRRRREGPALPLNGVPVLVKDNVEVAGLPSCAGATSLLGRPPAGDAPLVARIRAAGAVVLGSTNLSQWANIRSPRSTSGWSAAGGLTGNPWALDRNPGGSSSGSGAALAAGLAALAVGTETDGSITCPCTLNGVAGIKPAVGRVPTEGVVPVSPSQDSPGPMARTVAGVAALLTVLTGEPGGLPDQMAPRPDSLRVAVATTWRTFHPETDSLFDRTVDALRSSGMQVSEVSPPVPSPAEQEDELTVLLAEALVSLDRYLPTRGPGGPQNLAEVIRHEVEHAEVEMPWFGHEFFERAVAGGGTATSAYREARRRNLAWALEQVLEPALAGADLLVAPTMGPAWKSDLVLGGHPAAASPITMAPAIAGWPIATVPMGLAGGLPVGFGIVGRPGSESLMLRLGSMVERPARPAWRPPERG